jgi:hypothetical protein
MHFKQTRPHDRLDPVYRPNASGDERTHWKMKCLDWSVPSHSPSSGNRIVRCTDGDDCGFFFWS